MKKLFTGCFLFFLSVSAVTGNLANGILYLVDEVRYAKKEMKL